MNINWLGVLTTLSAPIGMVVTWLLSRHKTKREEWQQLYLQAEKDRDDYHDKWIAAEHYIEKLKRERERLRSEVNDLKQDREESKINEN